MVLLLAALMGVSSLDTLHRTLPNFSIRPEHHKAVNAAKKQLMQPLTDTAAAAPFLAAYDALMCEVIAPHVAEAMGGEGCDALHYSAFPTLRVQHPSGYGGIRPHCDGIYDLQPGSLNWWVALTSPSRGEACGTLRVFSRRSRRSSGRSRKATRGAPLGATLPRPHRSASTTRPSCARPRRASHALPAR